MDLVAPGSEEAMLPLWGPLARQLRGVRRVWESRGGEVRAPNQQMLPAQVEVMHQSTAQQVALLLAHHGLRCRQQCLSKVQCTDLLRRQLWQQ